MLFADHIVAHYSGFSRLLATIGKRVDSFASVISVSSFLIQQALNSFGRRASISVKFARGLLDYDAFEDGRLDDNLDQAENQGEASDYGCRRELEEATEDDDDTDHHSQ